MGRSGAKGIVGAQQGLHPAIRAIVLDALSKGVGETLATNSELRERLGVGAGTLQKALDLLTERGALGTTSRGHLGRRIDRIGVGECWQAAGLAPVRFALSPSGPIEMDVLEEALGSEMTELGIPHTARHLRGGSQRIEQVSQGLHDITAISAGTFDGMGALSGLATECARVLDSGTYYAQDRLVTLRRGTGGADRRIAIDRDSLDHAALTRAEFPEADGYAYVEVPFPEVPAYVLAGVVDAGIWHVTASAVPPELAGLSLSQLSSGRAIEVREALSRAVLVGWAGRPELRSVITELRLRNLETAQAVGFAAEAARRKRLADERTQAQS